MTRIYFMERLGKDFQYIIVQYYIALPQGGPTFFSITKLKVHELASLWELDERSRLSIVDLLSSVPAPEISVIQIRQYFRSNLRIFFIPKKTVISEPLSDP